MPSAIANPVNELPPKLEARLGEDGDTAEKGVKFVQKLSKFLLRGWKIRVWQDLNLRQTD